MEFSSILIIAIIIILVVLIIKFIAKTLFKLLLLIIIIVAGFFIYKTIVPGPDSEGFIIYNLQKEYCVESYDTLYCECIITPLIDYINTNYNSEELEKIKKDPLFRTKVLYECIKNCKADIKECLDNKNASGLWKRFFKDIRKKTKGEINKLFTKEDDLSFAR